MDAKKQRKANFSDVEVEVLVDAVGTSYKTLYGKFSPCLTNNMKTMAWESVTEKVNAVSLQCTRGVMEIKKKWQDMQSAVKKKEAQRRKHLTQTGGGPSQLPMLKPWEEKILQLIPQSAISGIEDGVDTSQVRSSPLMSQKPSCLEVPSFIVTEVPAEELENDVDTNSDVPVVSQSEEVLSKDSALNRSDSEDDSALKSTKIELQECHLRSAPVEDDGIPSQNSCGSIYVVFASIMASLSGVLFGYDIGIISGAVLQLRLIGDECIYISEIAPPKKRGQLVSLNELGITLGLLLAYLVNYLFINVTEGWRYMFGLSAIPAAIQGVGMFFLPKSPRFLALTGKDAEAEEVLLKLRDGRKMQVHRELEKIKSSLSNEKEHSGLGLLSSSDNMRGRMFIGAGLVFFQQCTGQPNVLYYAPTIFEGIGFESDSAATLATVGLGCVKVVMTVITQCCVDKWGRRRFLLTGATLMGVSLLLLGIISHLNDHVYGSNPCQESVQCTQAATDLTNNFTIPYSTTPQVFIANESYTLSEADWLSYYMDNYTATPPEEPHVHIHGSTLGKIAAFTSLMLYVAAFGFSFGPVSWLILSEIFPASVRGRAISLATVLNWGTNLVVSLTFLDIIENIGVSWTFVMFSVVCAVSVIFIFFAVPETRGKSLEQISKELNNRSLKSGIRAYCKRLHCCDPLTGSPIKLPNYHRVQSTDSFNEIS